LILEKGLVHNGWELDFLFPLQGRMMEKPRSRGITMILDKGLGLNATRDVLEMSAGFIDFWKLGFGSSALYDPRVLQRKIEAVNSFHVKIYPGGTFFEIAFSQGKTGSYLSRAAELGFSAIEISNGTINLGAQERSHAIKQALQEGFTVLTEIGKKEAGLPFQPELMAEQFNRDLEDGAFKVILEARESGKNVTIFNEQGSIDGDKINELLLSIKGEEHIIWEAPLKEQQIEFITRFGPGVNLGNIPSEDILALESFRHGLRADTFKLALAKPGNMPFP
jgi:phosphosulfolactate synthase